MNDVIGEIRLLDVNDIIFKFETINPPKTDHYYLVINSVFGLQEKEIIIEQEIKTIKSNMQIKIGRLTSNQYNALDFEISISLYEGSKEMRTNFKNLFDEAKLQMKEHFRNKIKELGLNQEELLDKQDED